MTKPKLPTAGSRELRHFRLETRDLDERQFIVSGLASSVESPYDMGWYTETIKRGAFTKTLAASPDVQLTVNHAGLPLARTTNGSLTLREDATGLHFTAQLQRDDEDAQRVMRKLADGLLTECSFAFRVVRQAWNDDYDQRSIQEVSLHRGDVSIVNYGANPNTPVTARAARRATVRDLRTYQARARALALAGRDRTVRLRNEAGRR
jgi:HK97 family phage prohead protease